MEGIVSKHQMFHRFSKVTKRDVRWAMSEVFGAASSIGSSPTAVGLLLAEASEGTQRST